MIYNLKNPWNYYFKPFRIMDNLYYVGNKDVSSYLIKTGDGLILHDTTYPQTVYLLLESIRELGFNPRDIKYIIHSHAHYDHVGGTKAIIELTGAKTFLGKEDIFILGREELTWAPEYGTSFYEKFTVDYPLQDGDHIKLGNIDIKCISIPGHTPGAVSYFFDIEDDAKIYRIGTHGGPGLNTLSDEYLKKYGLAYSNREDYLKSLEKLKKEQVDVFIGIHPGQCNLFEKVKNMSRKNPFINKNEWSDYLNILEENANKNFLKLNWKR